MNMVIGIEGLVGSGKTSICHELLKKIPNSILLDAGNLYRAIVFIMMKNGTTISSMRNSGKSLNIRELIDLLKIEVRLENRETVVYANGTKLSEKDLQAKETSLAVSEVSNTAENTKAFAFVHDLIEELKQKYHVIFSGRATMKIYPMCDYHFFIVADLEERVKRKWMQYKKEETIEEIRENVIRRDELQKKSGFYDYSPSTIEIDVTDCKTVEESAEEVLQKMKLEEVVEI